MRYLGFLFLLLAQGLSASDTRAESITFRTETTPKEWSATIRGDLSFPSGKGPFPMVILLHGCGGLQPIPLKSLQAHAKDLNTAGFGTLIYDSYAPRNLGNGKACGMWTGSFRIPDAFNAMAALQRHKKVSKENIFILGQSDGADAALASAHAPHPSLPPDGRGRFRAIAAYYPGCSLRLGGLSYVFQSPTIVFVGEKDDWTPPAACLKAKNTGAVTGAEFDVVAYRNAYHCFDHPRAAPVKYKAYTLAYDHEATVDSRKRFKEFFIKHLTDEFKGIPPFVGKAKQPN